MLVELAGSALTDVFAVGIAVIALAMLVWTPIGPAPVIGAGLVIGLIHAVIE